MTFEICTPEDVRGYLRMEGQVDADDLRYGNARLGSNIRAASSFLQRQTRRQLEPLTNATKRFTSNGLAVVPIVDLRSADSVTHQGVALELDAGDASTGWLIPDRATPEVYTAIQVRPFGGGDFRSHPQWFDRNLDRDYRRGYRTSTLPGDLVIVGDWGHDPYEPDLLMAAAVLAAWYTKRPDAVLANVAVTESGAELRYSDFPPEVTAFVTGWRLREEMAVAS